VNQAIRLINQFSIEAFLKQNQSFFFHKKKESAGKSAQYVLAQPSPASLATNGLDMKVICQLADQLMITIPRNMDLRSKAFLCHSKEQMLKKLFEALN
jgi:hypothetical protein